MILPRGLRLANPGNIRKGASWLGLTPTQPDTDFCMFLDLEHGYRALARVLRGYGKRGIDTPDKIAATYAPPSENDTGAYASVLAEILHVGRGDKLDMDDPKTLRMLCLAITHMECLAGAIARGVEMERDSLRQGEA